MHRAVLLLIVFCIGLEAHAVEQQNSAVALEQALQQACGDVEPWPGYDPLAVPLAVFDGTNTTLFRHPSPPEGFVTSGGLWIFEGRHPSVVANSSVTIGEVSTATVMLETLSPEGTPGERAALVAHEGFHVFQGTTGRRWGANEANLFTYPVDDAELLSLRRMETEALRRGIAASEPDEARAWAGHALGLREMRFAALDEAHRSYERGIETMEGTAAYVEHVFAGREELPLPEGGFDAEDVRGRAYTTGTAWALLLDRFSPNWQEGLAVSDTLFLDTALARTLRDAGQSTAALEFTASEMAAAEQVAHIDVKRVLEQRSERRLEFESVPGWSLVVEADAASPLWPQGFDPLNVHRVEGGVLHTRFLKLGNDSGRLEVMGMSALTEEVGPHPLFNGILSLTLTGFESEPEIREDDGSVIISSPGFTAEFVGAGVDRRDERVVVRLAPPMESSEAEPTGEAEPTDVGDAIIGWRQTYFVEGVLGAVPSDDVHDFYVSGQLFGVRGSLNRFLGFGSSIVEVVYPGSSEEDVRYAMLPAYGHVVPYFTCKPSPGGYGGPIVDWMIDLYLGGSPLSVVMTSDTDPDTGEVTSDVDWWWHWYVRSGVRLTRQSQGGTVWGLDVGTEFYDAEGEPGGSASCAYVAVTLTFGTIHAVAEEPGR